MNYELFLKAIDKISKLELPSISAHAKMAPAERLNYLKNGLDATITPKQAAVMMLLYPKNDRLYLVLIQRNAYPGVHSSQIAFPGGKVEQTDLNLAHTALRETHEEIGVSPEKITVIRNFTSVYIQPSNFMVHPFLGISNQELIFERQEEEVAGIIEMPISMLFDDSIVQHKTIETSYAKGIAIPSFQIHEHTVWGATAMMLSELKDTLSMVL